MNPLHPSGRLVLLAAGLGLTVWAWPTYPLDEHTWVPFASAAVLPTFVVVGVLISLPWPWGRAATDPGLVIGPTVMVWGWLFLGLVGAALLATTSLSGRSPLVNVIPRLKEIHPCPNLPARPPTPTVAGWPAKPRSARPQPPSDVAP